MLQSIFFKIRTKRSVLLFFFIVSISLVSCIDLSMHGPVDDYSDLPNDFISQSIKRNLRVGEPYGFVGLKNDAYFRFSNMGFDIELIRRDFESANVSCRKKMERLFCDVERSWLIVWPKNTQNGFNGELAIRKVRISYIVETNRNNGSVDVDFVILNNRD